MKKLHVRLGIFGSAPIGILQDGAVKPNALKVYLAISSYQGTQDSCAPSQDDIAIRAGIHVRHARAAIRNLVDTEWIEKRRRGRGMTDVYNTLAHLEESNPDRTESVRSQTGQNPCDIDRTESVQPERTESVRSIELDHLEDQKERPLSAAGAADEPGDLFGNRGNGHKTKGKKHTPEETGMFQRMGDLIRRGTVDHAEAERRKERGEARGPAWSGVKDSQALWRLIGFAQEQQPARTEEYLTALLEGAWALHQGEVAGMTDWDKRRWSAVPHVPSCLEGAKIEAALTALRYGAVPEVGGSRMSEEDTRELMANLEKVGRR